MNPLLIKPSRDRMLVRHAADEERISEGIILPDISNRTHCKAQIVAIGTSISDTLLNATIFLPNYSQPDFIHEGYRYTFIKENDLLAIIEDECEPIAQLPA